MKIYDQPILLSLKIHLTINVGGVFEYTFDKSIPRTASPWLISVKFVYKMCILFWIYCNFIAIKKLKEINQK